MPDETTFYCCPVFVLVGCTPELSFPTTSNNLCVCFPKATVRPCLGCRASSQRDFLVKRGLYDCHGSEKRIGIGMFRAEVWYNAKARGGLGGQWFAGQSAPQHCAPLTLWRNVKYRWHQCLDRTDIHVYPLCMLQHPSPFGSHLVTAWL